MTRETDYYTILGVDHRSSAHVIRAAFTTRLNSFPGEIDPTNEPEYQQVLQAYKVLSDPDRRATYDALLAETVPDVLMVDVTLSRDRVETSDSGQLVYALVDIHAREQDLKSSNPLNLCLVVDRSTSMRGARLGRVIAAVELILTKLAPDDVLSVVGFDDRAEVVLPAGPVTNFNALTARVRNMRASGGTEIYQGLSAGVREMQKVALDKHTNHLILMTDGHTYGDVDECLRLAQDMATKGVTFSAMGIGTEWNDQFLDKLVAPSGGQSHFAETPEDIVIQLQSQIKGLGQVFARNLRLIPKFPSSVSLEFGFKLTPFAQPLIKSRDQISLGDIEGKTPLTFLLELAVAPQRIETRINLVLQFLADIPSQQVRDKSLSRQLQLLILSETPQEMPPQPVVKAVRMLNMYRMNEKVWEAVESGQLEQARTRMQNLSTRLLEMGETRLAQQAYAETVRLADMGTVSPEGRKKLKYGTRALLRGTIEAWDNDD